jgi:hypothetical protein
MAMQVDIDDSTTNATLTPAEVLVHVGATGKGECDLLLTTGTAGKAALREQSACTLLVEGGVANLLVLTTDAALQGDGSLDLSVSGPVTAWPGDPSASGELALSFAGHR